MSQVEHEVHSDDQGAEYDPIGHGIHTEAELNE
jgi:hypothetical protein